MASDAWLTLVHAAAPADRRWLAALKSCGTAEALAARSRHALLALDLPVEAVERLKSPDSAAIERSRAWLAASDRRLVTFGDEHYPPLLAELVDAPLALWVQGANLSLLPGAQLAIVGSRNPTSGGRDNAQAFARYLAARGLTITSGLAIGIDGAGHRGALAEIGGTIAVLGGGLDSIYPRVHSDLAAAIAERGLLVSEYPPCVEPRKLHFPQRNRIIAGLTLGTLVVEATRRSGSLITARLAAEQNREVFAVPGSIQSFKSMGTHTLIKQGAKLVENAQDIVVELGQFLAAPTPAQESSAGDSRIEERYGLTTEESRVFQSLGPYPLHIDELIRRLAIEAGKLSGILLQLELKGIVQQLPGKLFLSTEKNGV